MSTKEATTQESSPAVNSAQPLRLSVGELVAFSCRRGDLIGDSLGGPSSQEGVRAHQRLQKQRPLGSEAEYKLEVRWQCEGQTVILSGRVDILHPKTDLHRPVQLDEIKTTYCPPEKLSDATRNLHWAQLKIYGFCYLVQQGAESQQASAEDQHIALQMLWHNLKEHKSYTELREFSWAELKSFTHSAIRDYLLWHRSWQQHCARMRKSARQLEFPFPSYRPGQRQLTVAAYRCIRDGGELLIEAPTGIGKTLSTLFPAIKAMGEEKLDQLLYLTAKNSGRQVVRETITHLHSAGLTLSLLEIQARDKSCACRLGLCSPDTDGTCPRTQGFFDRLPEARRQLLGKPLLTPELLARVADDFQLCPFELSLQMVPWADLVACDLNYVFDPLTRLNSLLEPGRRRVILVDEAHNLSDRGRKMYSVALSRAECRRAAAACKGRYQSLRRRIQMLVRQLDNWASQRDQRATGSNTKTWVTDWSDTETRPTAVTRAAQKIQDHILQLKEESRPPPESITEWLKILYRYLCIEPLAAREHRCLTRLERQGSSPGVQQLKLLCLNAADYLRESYRQFHAVIAFSATLSPPAYIVHQLGFRTDSPYLQLASPFSSEQLGVFVCPYVDTRYKTRHKATELLVDMVARVYQSRPGNYLVFFPSYQFLQQVAQAFNARFPQIDLLQQRPGASEQERAEFLSSFSEGHRSLGFAIMGGIFGEGVDYAGERLIGTILVGVGLPQVNEEQELLRRACDESGNLSVGSGFDIVYRYPGMTRVLQTAGRVIRTETDRGVLILADHRFVEPFYRALYPTHWRPQSCYCGEELSTGLDRFWAME